jgi:NAD-dependent dihydropyrimidine dehydrogenase PreA subunit
MTVINVTLPLAMIKEIDDYSKIINVILKQDISFNILKFSTGTNGINILLDVPDDKINSITETLKQNDIVVSRKGRINVDYDKCIDCGGCVSLCPTDALQLNPEFRLEYIEEKCVGCGLCIDSCPRFAIEES